MRTALLSLDHVSLRRLVAQLFHAPSFDLFTKSLSQRTHVRPHGQNVFDLESKMALEPYRPSHMFGFLLRSGVTLLGNLMVNWDYRNHSNGSITIGVITNMKSGNGERSWTQLSMNFFMSYLNILFPIFHHFQWCTNPAHKTSDLIFLKLRIADTV